MKYKEEKVVNLLMSAVGGDVACATLRALKQAGICDRICGFDIREVNQGRLYLDEFMIAPPYTDADIYENFIFNCCEDKGITHFWPVSESEIVWADARREKFQEFGVVLVINNRKIIEIGTSKYKTAKFLSEIGIQTPRTAYVEEIVNGEKKIDDIEFPLILKPDCGCGSKDIRVVKNSIEWENLDLQKYSGFVVQKYIGSKENEYTVGIYSDTSIITSIAFRRKLGMGGLSVEIETVDNEMITQIAEKVATELSLDGCINIQMREQEEKFYIFEINPRVSSTVGFRDLLGHKDAVWWLDHKSGRKYKPAYKVEAGIKGIKTYGEILFKDNTVSSFAGGGNIADKQYKCIETVSFP